MTAPARARKSTTRRVLNVGSAGMRDVPPIFDNWEQVTLDIDPRTKADVIADARELRRLPASTYDAVYCSHCLEHFYVHEVPSVLAGFAHLLKPTGFTYLAVPDIGALLAAVTDRDLNDVWYVSQGGPITFHDVLYGWSKQIAQGNLYYAHHTGFTEQSLSKALSAHFKSVLTATDGAGNLHAFAFKTKPTTRQLKELQLCR
jgi:hypothetical protein